MLMKQNHVMHSGFGAQQVNLYAGGTVTAGLPELVRVLDSNFPICVSVHLHFERTDVEPQTL